MQAQPWTTYTGDRYIADGFTSIADILQRARGSQIQQQQFDADLKERARAHDLGYYGGEQDRAAQYYGINTRASQAAQEMTLQHDPERVQPQELMDPATGQPMPNLYAIPMTGQILQPKAPATTKQDSNAATAVTDPSTGKVIGHKVILNGKESFVKPPTGALDLNSPMPQGNGPTPKDQGLFPALLQVKTADDYAKVPQGQDYLDPDGKRRTKQ